MIEQPHSRDPTPRTIPYPLTGGLTALGLLGAIYAAGTTSEAILPAQARIFLVAWLAVSVGCSFLITPRNFVVGFITGLFAMLVGWRIAGLHSVGIVTWPLLAAFAAFVLQFFDCLRSDRKRGASALLSASDWHLAFLRIYVGFDMVPHFTEKLYAGPGPRMDDIKAFTGFGLPMPEAFVILGGSANLASASEWAC